MTRSGGRRGRGLSLVWRLRCLGVGFAQSRRCRCGLRTILLEEVDFVCVRRGGEGEVLLTCGCDDDD